MFFSSIEHQAKQTKKYMENLNKENFWNKLRERFPDAVDFFCKWIDDYKKEVGWDVLFNAGYVKCLENPIRWVDSTAPKFHDLPFEMQNGILARFELELFNNADGKGKQHYENIAEAYKDVLEKIFKDLQLSMNKRSQKLN